MRFGPVALSDAEGAILAHSVTLNGQRLRKGQELTAKDLTALAAAGHETVIVARLDATDLHEDTAANRLAAALVPDPGAARLRVTAPFTGRVNLIAEGPGVVCLDTEAIERVNRVHPMITVATVPQHQQMAQGGMAATIKIISYAVPETDLQRAVEQAGDGAIRLAGPVHRDAALILTEIAGAREDTKGERAIGGRIEALGMTLRSTRRVPHVTDHLAQALIEAEGDILMILTGSATSDPHDVAPEAVRRAGGTVERFGMPVDPGNLLFLGELGGKPVIGLPGCARSPALNGADWVLSRVACGVQVTDADIAAMGVGGLLKEIPTRPQPRAGKKK